MENIQTKLIRADEDSPTRCVTIGASGQCPFEAVPGTKYCARHKGEQALRLKEKKAAERYMVGKWQARVNQLSDSPALRSLRDEIAILRVIIETRMKACKSDNDLVMNSQAISDLVTKAGKLVEQCNALEIKTNVLLDKSTALAFSSRIVEIITSHITDPQKQEDISNDIIQALVEKSEGK